MSASMTASMRSSRATTWRIPSPLPTSISKRLGVPPAHCLALEDSNIGLTAAHAAGTMAIMVPDVLQPTDELRAKGLHVAPDLHAVLRLVQPRLPPAG